MVNVYKKRLNEVIIMIFEYTIDNNEYYPEDHSKVSIFSMEPVSTKEFYDTLIEAEKSPLESKDIYGLARKMVEINDKFFFPEHKGTIYFGHDRDADPFDETNDDKYETKIRGVHLK